MSISSAISENWWAIVAVIGGVLSLLIDVFLFYIVWRLYAWLNRRAEPVATFEERLIALENAEAANTRLLETVTAALREMRR